MYSDVVYAVLNIISGEYITLNGKTVLCETQQLAKHIIDVAAGDLDYYNGFPRKAYKIGKSSLLDYEFFPDALEFDVVDIPRDVLNEEALTHMLTTNHSIYNWYSSAI